MCEGLGLDCRTLRQYTRLKQAMVLYKRVGESKLWGSDLSWGLWLVGSCR